MPVNSRSRDDRGAIAVLTAISATMLLVAAAFAVDLGNTWARRGQLQVQADRAATYAASYLPADSVAEKTEVAKAVAFYLACHTVAGQIGTVNGVARPVCPADPQSSSLDGYAAQLLTASLVTFPARNQVKVVTPTARIEFGFAKVAGADGTNQQKQATAKVTSPGMLSPMAMTLDCLVNPYSNTVGPSPLPFGYIATTHRAAASEPALPANETPSVATPNQVGIEPGQLEQTILGLSTSVIRISGRQWPAIPVPPLPSTRTYAAVFKRGTQRFESTVVLGWTPSQSGANPQRRGYIDVTVPTAVMRVSGTWKVQVIVRAGLAPATYTSDFATLDIVSPYPDVRGCGRLLKSPRGGNQNNANFSLNLQEGIDHLLTTYPSLVSTNPTSIADMYSMFGLTECNASSPSTVRDNVHPPGTPNCLVTDMSNAYEAGFTEGLIGANGRMTCIDAHPCEPGRSFTLNSRLVNNDRFTDYVKNTSLLTHSTFFSFDSFLATGTPVVTPTSNLDREIYNSGRFMWVPVISTLTATSAVAAGDYPVITFRPIFVTQGDDVLESLPLLNSGLLPVGLGVSEAVEVVDGFMRQSIPGTDNNGLIMDGNQVTAVRFLSISPDGLPAVPADYAGPESEYLGIGPRIIRLVE